jgi:ribonuclease P/MRP protein subunit RPP1
MILYGTSRARWLDTLRRNLQIARKFELTLAITAGAKSYLDLKTPRDLLALAELAGFTSAEAMEALQQPGIIVELNRRKWLGPGVELL